MAASGVNLPNFVFRFDALLQYRRHRRDLCRQVLAQVLADDRALVEQRQLLEQNRISQLQQLRQIVGDGEVNVDAAASRRYFAGRLVADIADTERNRDLVSQQIEVCRAVLTKADQDVKVLEKLREQRQAEFLYEEDRRSTRELEDNWMATRLAGSEI